MKSDTHLMTEKQKLTALVTFCYDFSSRFFRQEELIPLISDAVEEVNSSIDEYNVVFDAIDEHDGKDHITHSIEKKIQSAAVVIFEISDQNKNVFYELGLARGADRRCVLLKEEKSDNKDLPIDVRSLNYISYDSRELGKLKRLIVERLKKELSSFSPLDAIPQETQELIWSKYAKIVTTNREFNDLLIEAFKDVKTNFYYLGTSSLVSNDRKLSEKYHNVFRGIESAHRIVYLRSLYEIWKAYRDTDLVIEYAMWLCTYYRLVRDGVFTLWTTPEVGSWRKGMSLLVLDEQLSIVLLGHNQDFNRKAIFIYEKNWANFSKQYAKELAQAHSTKKVKASKFGRYFTIQKDNTLTQIPETILDCIDGEESNLESACSQYVNNYLDDE